MFLKTYRVYLIGLLCLMFAGQPAKAQTDSLFLSVDQLFERGVQHSLQLQADALKEAMAQERTQTARTSASGIERRFCGTAGRLGTGIVRPDISGYSGLVTELRHRLFPTTVSRWQDSEDYP